MLSLTKQALEAFDNQHDFERMSADILNGWGYKDVVLMAPKGGGDGGRDITFVFDGGIGLACVSLRKDMDRKFAEDFGQRKPGEFAKYLLFCNSSLTASQKDKYTEYCHSKLLAGFTPQDVEALRSLLDSRFTSIRDRYLQAILPQANQKVGFHFMFKGTPKELSELLEWEHWLNTNYAFRWWDYKSSPNESLNATVIQAIQGEPYVIGSINAIPQTDDQTIVVGQPGGIQMPAEMNPTHIEGNPLFEKAWAAVYGLALVKKRLIP